MNLIEKITEMLVDDLIPYQQYISAPVTINLPHYTKVTISPKEIHVIHSCFSPEHFEITIMAADNVFFQHRPEYKGLFVKDIIADIEELIKKHIPNIRDNKVKAELIVNKIRSLEEELEKCNTP